MDEVRIWRVVDEQLGKPRVVPIDGVDATSTEQLLEEVLAHTPEVLMSDLTLIGRQNETAGGPLDLLGVDGDGRLVVFELKKGTLTRDAVAQVVDYASFLHTLETEELNRHLTESSGRGGTQKLEDFGSWYQDNFDNSIADIGRPRMVLVGLGVDERAKRMVEFLATADVDISLITFYGFRQDGQTLLARQVEVAARSADQSVKVSKRSNQERLDERLGGFGLTTLYSAMVAALREELGTSVYQWPNPGGYTFYLPEVTEAGRSTNRAYLSLYVPDSFKVNSRLQLAIQARAVEAIGKETLQTLASELHGNLSVKPTGWAEIWLDGKRPMLDYETGLRNLGKSVHASWEARRANADAKATG